MLTPRAYWDQEMVLWEEHPTDPKRLRLAWSPAAPLTERTEGLWVKRWALEYLGVRLVPTC